MKEILKSGNSIYGLKKEKDMSITFLRCISALAVVYIHIIATWGQSSIHYSEFYEKSTLRFLFDATTHSIGRFGVPIFLMISGALLLDSKRVLSVDKIWRYIRRMLFVLFTFGLVYNIIELYFNMGCLSGRVVIDAFVNLLLGKSWNHMWYVYAMIGIYIMLPITKAFVDNVSDSVLNYAAIVLFGTSIVINTLGSWLQLEFTVFLLEVHVAHFYFLVGHLIYTDKLFIFNKQKYYKMCMLFGGACVIATNLYHIYNCGELITNNTEPSNIFVALYAMGMFGYVTKKDEFKKLGKCRIVDSVSKHSFVIYLCSPFFQHVLFKGLGLFPNEFPMFIGEAIIYLIIVLLSLLSSIILHKIPFIKEIV